MKPQIDFAIDLVRRGASLIPYVRTSDGRKTPIQKYKDLDRLPVQTEEDVANAMQKGCHGFQFYPHEIGLCVIDIDIKADKNGKKSLEDALKSHGISLDWDKLNRFVVQSPSGGYHIYCKADENTPSYSEQGIIHGIDLICDNALIVIPGSVGLDPESGEWKTYTALGSLDNVIEIPGALSQMFKSIKDEKERKKKEEQDRRMAEAEDRRMAGHYQGGDLFGEAKRRISASLIESLFNNHANCHWSGNEYFCCNPLRNDSRPTSFSINALNGLYSDFADKSCRGDFISLLSESEGITLREAACMIIRETGGNPDDYDGEWVSDLPTIPIDIESIMKAAYERKMVKEKQSVVTAIMEHEEKSTEDQESMVSKLEVVFGSDLPNEYQPPDEIIEDMFVSRSVSVIYGDSNSGKTFFALSIACALSEGMSCYGKQVDQGIVVYLAVEAPETIKPRMQALKRYYKRDLSSLAMVPKPLNFYSGDESGNKDATDVVLLVKELERTTGKKVKMIIGDTLARMANGANENSGEDMGPVMARFSAVAERTGACVLVIHHTGKDAARGARGWSGIRAHIDTEIEVTESNKQHVATITKQRALGSKDHQIPFSLEVMEMGISKFGKTATTCVAIPSDHEPVTKEDKKTSDIKYRLTKAWEYGGMKFTEDEYPYVSYTDFKEYIKEKEGKKDTSAAQMLKPASKGYIVNQLIDGNVIQKFGNGFIVTDMTLSVKMHMKASSERLI